MARFDWYQATIRGTNAAIIATRIQSGYEFADIAPSNAKNGYLHGSEIRTGSDVHATIWWGGNPGVHVKSTGEKSPKVSDILREYKHRVTRADACEDWIEKGLFDRISKPLISYALANNIKINYQGDWPRNQSRTLTLGSRTSTSQLVLYEKGYEIGLENGGHPDHVRLEVRIYPKRDAGYIVSEMQPGELFGATRWLTAAMKCIGWDHLEEFRIGTVWRPTDSQRSKRALLKQYGRILSEWADDVGGWECLGQDIAVQITSIQNETSISDVYKQLVDKSLVDKQLADKQLVDKQLVDNKEVAIGRTAMEPLRQPFPKATVIE